MKKRLNMSGLEKEIALIETDIVVEEQYNADTNYSFFDNELKKVIAQIPYPGTELYTTAVDYEDRDRIIHEKESNKPYWNERDSIKLYCDNGSLYCGHLNFSGTHYYIMDSRLVPTKLINVNGEDIWLINVDDRLYADYIKWWRYPSENNNIQYSRNIIMQNRKVSDVDIIIDKNSEVFSGISDAYLRKALMRNKDRNNIQSIIQTIQKKQDYIRSLPKGKSFIVQGCAGSGKTMVLLHRLRYLLYNKEINNNEYIFLVPGNSFKEFIDGISKEFNISKKNIFSYQEYYQQVLDEKIENSGIDISELVFPSQYLEKIYSKAFMCEVYKSIFDLFFTQIELLITFCENKFNDVISLEKNVLENEINKAKKGAIIISNETVKKLQDYTDTKIGNTFENIEILIAELEDVYSKRKSEYEKSVDSNLDVEISPDDARLLSNERLLEINKSIEFEKKAVENASVFTAISHRNKLKKLQETYQLVYEEIVSVLKNEDKKKYAEQATKLIFAYENITLVELEGILEKLKLVNNTANEHISKLQVNLDNIEQYIGEKYAKEIECLNNLIVLSSEIINLKKEYVENLKPSYLFFEENISLGIELLDCFSKYITQEDNDFLKENLQLFVKKTKNQMYAYLNTLMFNSCKKLIFKGFGIKISEIYKHYWYLNLYCTYLTRPIKLTDIKYVFIDEAQDLSVSEIELIYKINNLNDKPVINLFGDTNQMITTHGIDDWSKLQMVPEIYILEENFRNTNQIVEYCNKNLVINMVKIGVDMDDVVEYQKICDALEGSENIEDNPIFIVKDDYSVLDLEALLSQTPIKNYDIYTVKSVKGLEFKEVFVFDDSMNLNEKYISYTRALAKLNVIKTLPKMASEAKELIVQGE